MSRNGTAAACSQPSSFTEKALCADPHSITETHRMSAAAVPQANVTMFPTSERGKEREGDRDRQKQGQTSRDRQSKDNKNNDRDE